MVYGQITSDLSKVAHYCYKGFRRPMSNEECARKIVPFLRVVWESWAWASKAYFGERHVS